MAFSVGTVFSLGGAVAGLLDGEPPPLKLNGIALENAESPEKVEFGGAQQLTVHHMPGGGRVVDAMGREDRDIKLSGFFEGSKAMERARLFDKLRISGGKQKLTWADEVRYVVIKDFECEYQHAGFWMPYSMTLLVLPPERGKSGRRITASTLGQDIAKGLGLGAIAPVLEQAKGYLEQAQKLLPIVGIVAPRLAATAGGFMASASGVVAGGLSVSEGRLSGLSQAATGFQGAATSVRLLGQTSAAKDMAASVTAGAFVGRAAGSARTLAAGG